MGFEQLNHFLTHAPILWIDDPEKDFIVYIDAYKEGLGGVLMEEGHATC